MHRDSVVTLQICLIIFTKCKYWLSLLDINLEKVLAKWVDECLVN